MIPHILRRTAPLAAALCLLASASARADVVFTFASGSAGGGPGNVLFNVAGLLNDGPVIEGIVNGPNTEIQIASGTVSGLVLGTPATTSFLFGAPTESLHGDGGQALFDGVGDSLINNDFRITAEAGFVFTQIELNLNSPVGVNTPFDAYAEDTQGDIYVASQQLGSLTAGSGSNRLLSMVINGQQISSLTIDLAAGFTLEDVRQIRLETAPIGQPPQAIPEFGTVASLGALLGLGGLGMVRTRRRKSS